MKRALETSSAWLLSLLAACQSGAVDGSTPAPEQAVAKLEWEAPTLNADLTPLTDLGGYNVYYGTTPRLGDDIGGYTTVLDIGSASCSTMSGTEICTYTLSGGFTTTAYYFAVTAYDLSGNESLPSNEASKTFE